MPPKPKNREFTGVCVFCGSGALQMNGVTKHGQRYRCKGCGRVMCGFPVPETTLAGRQSTAHPFRCPKCKGVSRVHSREPDGCCRLRCTVCAKNFTDSYLISPPEMNGVPHPYRKRFNFNVAAWDALLGVCRTKGMSPVQAIRFVLRDEAQTPPVFAVALRGRVLPRRQVAPELPAPEVLAEPLPDKRIDAMRAGRRKALENGLRGTAYTVGVVERVRVCMDDSAKAGLLRAMAKYGCDHQEALRRLLADGGRWRRW